MPEYLFNSARIRHGFFVVKIINPTPHPKGSDVNSKKRLSLKEVAGKLDISYKNALSLAHEKVIPAFKFKPTGQWYIYEDDFNVFLNSKKYLGILRKDNEQTA